MARTPPVNQKERLTHIDFLRAIAIIAMISAHVLSYNLGAAPVNTMWNYLHFAVVLFIFCSGYLFFLQFENTPWTRFVYARWIQKRSMRLLPLYYGFLLSHYALWLLFPAVFSGLGLQKTGAFILNSFLLIGVDYGWLPLLFLELMVVSPLFALLFRNAKSRSATTAVLLTSATILLFQPMRFIDYRLIMWIPWSVVIFFSFYYARMKHAQQITRKRLYITGSAAVAVYILGSILLSNWGIPLTLTLHKYPPDIWYLSYGIAAGCMFLIIAPSRVFILAPLQKPIAWISQNSYALFFVHYLVIDIIRTCQHAYALTLSLAAQLLLSLGGSIGTIALHQQVSNLRNK